MKKNSKLFGIGNYMELSSLRLTKTLIENFGKITLFYCNYNTGQLIRNKHFFLEMILTYISPQTINIFVSDTCSEFAKGSNKSSNLFNDFMFFG